MVNILKWSYKLTGVRTESSWLGLAGLKNVSFLLKVLFKHLVEISLRIQAFNHFLKRSIYGNKVHPRPECHGEAISLPTVRQQI